MLRARLLLSLEGPVSDTQTCFTFLFLPFVFTASKRWPNSLLAGVELALSPPRRPQTLARRVRGYSSSPRRNFYLRG